MATPAVEVVFSFDTTGSMYPCLAQVRRNVKNTVTRLFEEIPGIRIGVIAHGDYCDKGSTYVTSHLPLTKDVNAIVKFVETVKPTGGGDAPECYELVLHEAELALQNLAEGRPASHGFTHVPGATMLPALATL